MGKATSLVLGKTVFRTKPPFSFLIKKRQLVLLEARLDEGTLVAKGT